MGYVDEIKKELDLERKRVKRVKVEQKKVLDELNNKIRRKSKALDLLEEKNVRKKVVDKPATEKVRTPVSEGGAQGQGQASNQSVS